MTLPRWCMGGEYCIRCGALSHMVHGFPSLLPLLLGEFLSLFTQVMWLGNKCCASTIGVDFGAYHEKMQSKGDNSRKIKEIFLFPLPKLSWQ